MVKTKNQSKGGSEEHIDRINKEWEEALPGISGQIREIEMNNKFHG